MCVGVGTNLLNLRYNCVYRYSKREWPPAPFGGDAKTTGRIEDYVPSTSQYAYKSTLGKTEQRPRPDSGPQPANSAHCTGHLAK